MARSRPAHRWSSRSLARSLLVFGLGGELATSVVGVGLLLENTVAAQQDTILVVTGFVLAMFAALHYWLPKVTGRAVHEGPAKAAAAIIFVSAAVYGLSMFFAGLAGQPVDIFRYLESDGVSTLNLIASIASFFLFLGVFLELVTLARSYNGGRPVGHDPWQGSTLEWFALSPPPPHNFDAVPDVRSAGTALRHPRGDPRTRGDLRPARAARGERPVRGGSARPRRRCRDVQGSRRDRRADSEPRRHRLRGSTRAGV